MVVPVGPPVTTASLAPPPDESNGWHSVPVTVTLTATDNSGLGIDTTKHRVDGGGWQTYSAPFTVSGDGNHAVDFYSTDKFGNTEDTTSVAVKIDATDPTSSGSISPAPQGGWYASPAVTLTGDDGSGSEIDHISHKVDGEASWHTYSSPLSGFTTGNHFVQFFATDVAGRVEQTVHLLAFKADSDLPTVNIVTPPDGAVYPLDSSKTATYKCTDKQSGLASCVCAVPYGSPVDTSTIGTHTFSVTGTDVAGNSRTVTVHYTVVYTWNGFFRPIGNEADQSLNLVHACDLIKLGFGLNGDRGLDVLAPGSPDSVPVLCPSWPVHTVPAAGVGPRPGCRSAWRRATTLTAGRPRPAGPGPAASSGSR